MTERPLVLDGPPMVGSNAENWAVRGAEPVGHVTSAVYSPRLEQNIALAIVDVGSAAEGTELIVFAEGGKERAATVVPKPFFDPKKRLAAAG